jgi:hypothetical protein
MNKTIKNIGKYFSSFESFELLLDRRNEKVDFDLIELEQSLQEELRKFEKDLQLIYLEGDELVLMRVRKELVKTEKILKQELNIGINIIFKDSGQNFIIEPGLIDSINQMKLKYANKLITIIDYYLDNEQIEIGLNFTNNFDSVEPKDVFLHFKPYLVDKGYLSELELKKYLKAAFEVKKTPKQLFKIKDAITKKSVTKVFYLYYKNVAGKPHGKQKEYAALLGDYFEGYSTELIITNFSR